MLFDDMPQGAPGSDMPAGDQPAEGGAPAPEEAAEAPAEGGEEPSGDAPAM